MTAAFDLDVLPLVGLDRGAIIGADAPQHPDVSAPSVSRELAVEALRLLRVRRGMLAEPDAWSEPVRRRQVAAILGQLQPIRSRTSLVSSYEREASREDMVRHAYAIRWLELARAIPAATVRRGRAARVSRPVLRRR